MDPHLQDPLPESRSVFSLFHKQKALKARSQTTEGPGARPSAPCAAVRHGIPVLVEPHLPGPQRRLAVDGVTEYMCWPLEPLCLRCSGPDPTPPWTLGCAGSACPTTLLLGQLFPLSGAPVRSLGVHQLRLVRMRFLNP